MKKCEVNNNINIYYDIDFNENINNLEICNHDMNWPITYIIYNKSKLKAYIGETTSFKNRMMEHLNSEKKKLFNKVLFVDYKYANKSTILYLESFLIRGMSVSGEFFNEIINIKSNSNKHNYYNEKKDNAMCIEIWKALKSEIGIARLDYEDIIQKNEYKYSPYIALNENQNNVINNIIDELITNKKNTIVVNGESGTGKSAVAIQLFKRITDYSNSNGKITEDMAGEDLERIIKINNTFCNNKYKIAYIAPMNNFCNIIRKSIKKISGLRKKDIELNGNAINSDDLNKLRVYSAIDLHKLVDIIEKDKPIFDLIIVDETHRLNRRYNLSNGNGYRLFNDMNKKLGLKHNKNKEDGNQIDWIRKISKNQVFFYDERQSIRSSDIPKEYFEEIFKDAHKEKLTIQERCLGGEKYIEYIKSIFSDKPEKNKILFKEYDFKMFDSFKEMKNTIDKCEGKKLLASGYDFVSTNSKYDKKIEDIELKWNQTNIDWVNNKNKKTNEVGCIHVLGGVDVDYLGIIIGKEIDYDFDTKKIKVNKEYYKDKIGRKCIDNDEQLISYVENIYYILLTRAMKGTYIFVENPNMKKYLEKYIEKNKY